MLRLFQVTLVIISFNIIVKSKLREQCGVRTSENHFPWLVGIEFDEKPDSKTRSVCAGALVSKYHVVGKAECFGSGALFFAKYVRFGPFNTSVVGNCTEDGSGNNCTQAILRVPIEMVVKHSVYLALHSTLKLHDIALITLRETVPYTDFIRPICLPSADIRLSAAADNAWYVTGISSVNSSKDFERSTAATYVADEKCDNVRTTSLWFEDDICVTDVENISSCLIRGALLMNKRGETYELVGLSETVAKCPNTRIFTNMFLYVDWLRSKIPEWSRKYDIMIVREWKIGLRDIADARSKADVCGKRRIEHVELLTNGEATRPGDWPWHVAIYKLDGASFQYICGGTLISKRMVLTAAHCATINGDPVPAEILSVILGKYNLISEDPESQERKVDQVIVHENFVPRNYLENDIALLKMKTEATYNNYIQSICWSSEAFQRLRNGSVLGTVVGWGVEQSGGLSFQLKQQQIPMVSELTCLKKNPTFYSGVLGNNKKFCAGWANGTSPCNGDSGGGFVVFVSDSETDDAPDAVGSWYLRGIVSLTYSLRNQAQCNPNQYVVFTDVTKYTDWIQSHLVNKSQPLCKYTKATLWIYLLIYLLSQ